VVHAQPPATQIPDPDPEIERRSFQVAEGFEVNLFAADPLLAKPIQMNFDPAGRLWIACSAVYPQIQPAQEANDRIIILEDRAGKGRADKTIVFAKDLLIPTGVVPGDGGCYVAEGTRLLHLAAPDRLAATRTAERDTPPVANAPGSPVNNAPNPHRRIVLSGFGTQDTHHLIHTLRWGPDGMLYFNQSVYIYSAIETPFGVRRLLGGGIWQYRPETEQLEVFARGWVNPWGHQFDRWGQSFVTDGAGDQGISYLVPGATQGQTFYPAPVPPRLLQGLTPHSPKYCGHEILSGRHLPEEWRGNILANDFRAHRVCRFVLREEGSGYTVKELPELIKTNHPGFRPVDVKMGPDGAIYIADWYNPIINHGEVDFRDPRRDHVHGRIWRVTAKGRLLVPRPNVEGAETAALLDALKSPEDWTRQQAKRVLKERGSSILPVLQTWLRNLDSADSDYEHQLLEGLWTYQSLNVVEPTLLSTLLGARDHHARAAATRVASAWHSLLNNPMELLAAPVQDDHPQVRLEAVRALAQIHQSQSLELALQVLDRPLDTNLDYALWLTTRELMPYWLPAFQAGHLDFRGNARHLAFALEAAGTQAPLRPLVELLQSGKVKEGRDKLLTLLAALGGPEDLKLVFDEVLAGAKQTPQLQSHLLVALDQAAGQRGVRPKGDLNKIESLLESDDESIRASAARLAGRWHLESLRPHLDRLAGDEKLPEPVRRAAIDGLVYLGGSPTLERLKQLTDPAQPAAVRIPGIVALTNVDLKLAAARAVDLLANDKEAADPAEIVNAFLERKNGPAILAEALSKAKLPPDIAKLAVRTARTSGQDSPILVAALTRAGGLSQVKRALEPKELQTMAAEVLKSGDPSRGEALFRRSDLACLKCHAIGGAGGQVGPDLTSIGTSAPVDYLIESVLLPNKAVKENYHALIVSTQDGRFFTGIKVRETNTEIVLRTAEDREQVIPVKDIEERSPGGSLMPEGLADNLTRAELVDLVRFLSELGKVGPYSASRARVVRRWQVLDATPAALRLAATRLAERSANRVAAKPGLDDSSLTWSSAYSQVNGTLPLDSLPRFKDHNNSTAFAFVRFQLDASAGGPTKLVLNSPSGLSIWLDGEPVGAQNEFNLDVKPGLHMVTVGVDVDRRKEGLRCELEELPSSTARVRIVAGK
jgi:putative heme-binding domain-containing protein